MLRATRYLVATAGTRLMHTTSQCCDKVGFIGLGNMGMPMATNLINAGHHLVVHDRTDAASRLAAQHSNVIVCAAPAEVASHSGLSAIITMLPSAAAVQDVYTGSTGLLAAPGGVTAPLLIDSSTIDPGTTRTVASAAARAPLHPNTRPLGDAPVPAFVDAPVSGGVPGAAAATLTFMCGGSEAALAAAEPLLRLMGAKTLHCGPAGCGAAAKVCNNLVLGVSMAAVAEGLALGRELGLDPALLTRVFNTSSARCWSSDTYSPCPGVMEGVPSSRNYQGGFAASLMVKDLKLASQAAQQAHAVVPLAQAAEGLYAAVAETAPGLDFSAVYQVVYGRTKGGS